MLSIIIPCFNHEASLLRAIDSAEKVRGVCEVIIVDDCSTDNSLELIQSIAAERKNIRYFCNPKNSGPGYSRNRGVHEAGGQYLAFLDADDELINAGFYEQAQEVIRQDPSIRAIKANMEFFDPVKGWILPDYDPRYVPAVLSSACATVIQRDMFLRMGGFSEDVVFRGPNGGEDVAFMQALMNCGSLGKIDVVSYRVWSKDGGHADRFLAMTRLTNSGFEFVIRGQEDSDVVERAVEEFKQMVIKRMKESE
ncbi:glycosyltransferase family 2 protein [Uliginosibacterium sp. H3]|uniref:Glycosyltransferase family 2 protein n=1 Tax=Uliginosibacterium silvisoli TaxID=3114758 RepID=A0ABU6K7P2_9RHOO|nr:glycosyltransferase family 2 protein [Uliginosibacterium sp. H3]